MLKYICDICGKEFKHLSPRFQVRKGPQAVYFDRPAVAQISTVFISHDPSVEHICAACIKDATEREIDVP